MHVMGLETAHIPCHGHQSQLSSPVTAPPASFPGYVEEENVLKSHTTIFISKSSKQEAGCSTHLSSCLKVTVTGGSHLLQL